MLGSTSTRIRVEIVEEMNGLAPLTNLEGSQPSPRKTPPPKHCANQKWADHTQDTQGAPDCMRNTESQNPNLADTTLACCSG